MTRKEFEKVYDRVLKKHDIIVEEYENGADYTRDEYNFDDGYISALDWVLTLMEKEMSKHVEEE